MVGLFCAVVGLFYFLPQSPDAGRVRHIYVRKHRKKVKDLLQRKRDLLKSPTTEPQSPDAGRVRAGAPVSGGMTFDPSGPGLETAAAANGLTVTVSGVADFGNQQ